MPEDGGVEQRMGGQRMKDGSQREKDQPHLRHADCLAMC